MQRYSRNLQRELYFLHSNRYSLVLVIEQDLLILEWHKIFYHVNIPSTALFLVITLELGMLEVANAHDQAPSSEVALPHIKRHGTVYAVSHLILQPWLGLKPIVRFIVGILCEFERNTAST